jgi:hypothetical protein
VHCVGAHDCAARIVVVDDQVVVVAGALLAPNVVAVIVSSVVVVVVVASTAVDETVGDLVAPPIAPVVVPLDAPPDVVDAPLRLYAPLLYVVVVLVVVNEVAGDLVVFVAAPFAVVVSAMRIYALMLDVFVVVAVDKAAGDHVASHVAHVDAPRVAPLVFVAPPLVAPCDVVAVVVVVGYVAYVDVVDVDVVGHVDHIVLAHDIRRNVDAPCVVVDACASIAFDVVDVPVHMVYYGLIHVLLAIVDHIMTAPMRCVSCWISSPMKFAVMKIINPEDPQSRLLAM